MTVAKKEGDVKKELNKSGKKIRVVDLPGAYSLAAFTSEENITSAFVKNEAPDVIINIVDATNLSRSLLFTTQLLELGIPLVIALNKSDLLDNKKIAVDSEKLAERLGCPVVATASIEGEGLVELIAAAAASFGRSQPAPFHPSAGPKGQTPQPAAAVDRERFAFVDAVVAEVEVRKVDSAKQTRQDAIDRVLTHRIAGIPIFAAVIYFVFSVSQTYVGPLLADILVGWIDRLYVWTEGLIGASVSPLLSALLLDGIIGGVGAVIGFLPLIMVLFFLLALLEDCGYMARVAVVMDRHMKKVGLSGRSIIPMVIGTGCAIPGIMATRTIRDERQRRTTVMLTPFMPCGAKLPVIALFAGVFFEDAAWVGTSMYFVAIAIIIFAARIVHKIVKPSPAKSYFIMELPDYRVPSLKRAAISMLARGKAFVVNAGTVILLCNVIVQIMKTFTWDFKIVEAGMESTSILAGVARPLAFLLIPLGFGAWQLAAAAVVGFIAKENVVGTLAVVYSISNFIDTEELVLVSGAQDVASIMGLTSASALAYLLFNLFTPPCFAAIGAMKAEMESSKWLWGAIGFQFGMGYTLAYFVHQIGTLLTTGRFGPGMIPGLIAVALMAAIIGYLIRKKDAKGEARHVR
ncbi:ferrous iron transport protein B [Trichococcus patagoniensis]|uniref:Ferrous iron transport protein B n=1 Tax=Trichococcus patagoniensis TaxID=382641 RepID=A0A2T5IQ14_9LACT|nr:ferrous iron transport protein B [Trichococcus patagoniensis]